eukprot:Awhi_evm1s11149
MEEDHYEPNCQDLIKFGNTLVFKEVERNERRNVRIMVERFNLFLPFQLKLEVKTSEHEEQGELAKITLSYSVKKFSHSKRVYFTYSKKNAEKRTQHQRNRFQNPKINFGSNNSTSNNEDESNKRTDKSCDYSIYEIKRWKVDIDPKTVENNCPTNSLFPTELNSFQDGDIQKKLPESTFVKNQFHCQIDSCENELEKVFLTSKAEEPLYYYKGKYCHHCKNTDSIVKKILENDTMEPTEWEKLQWMDQHHFSFQLDLCRNFGRFGYRSIDEFYHSLLPNYKNYYNEKTLENFEKTGGFGYKLNEYIAQRIHSIREILNLTNKKIAEKESECDFQQGEGYTDDESYYEDSSAYLGVFKRGIEMKLLHDNVREINAVLPNFVAVVDIENAFGYKRKKKVEIKE